MSHVVASYVCRKNIFYNQISLNGFSTFSIISLAFSIASAIPALLKLLKFIAISLSSSIVLFRSTIHFAYSVLITESLRETLTSAAAIPALNCFDTSLANQEMQLISLNWSVTLTVVVKKKKPMVIWPGHELIFCFQNRISKE